MKKEFFNPSLARFVDQTTGKSYRARRSLRFGSACFRTDAGLAETEEEKAADLLLKVKTQAEKEMNLRGATKENIDKFNEMLNSWSKLPVDAIRALADENTGIMKTVQGLASRVEGIETGKVGGKQKALTIREQILKYQEENKDIFTEIRSKRKQVPLPEIELNLRVPDVPQTPAVSIGANTAPYLTGYTQEPGLNDIPSNPFVFWNTITKGRTSKPSTVWINKTNREGAAGFILPGVLKPFISFDVIAVTASAVKVAAADKVALELLEDVDQWESWIKDELRWQVLYAVNSKLMVNPATAGEPTGIKNLSVAYTATGVKTKTPGYADALRAVVAQIRSGNLVGEITIFINPQDSANMDMQKAVTSGVYMLPPFMTNDGKTIAGAKVVEDANIPVGAFQAGILRYYKILIYKDMVISFGWENDDFRRNLLTYLCEMRFVQAFNTAYTGAFVYDTFANVLTAITLP
jgi:hypothetical protein